MAQSADLFSNDKRVDVKNEQAVEKISWDKYQPMAVANMNSDISKLERIGNCALGLADEIFELAELLYSHWDGKFQVHVAIDESVSSLDKRRKVILELGDILWYCSVLADLFKSRMSNICSFLPFSRCDYSSSGSNAAVTFELSKLLVDMVPITTHCKHVVYHGHKIDSIMTNEIIVAIVKVVEHVCKIAIEFSATLENVVEFNVLKLRKRYPDGFSSERSVNRPED